MSSLNDKVAKEMNSMSPEEWYEGGPVVSGSPSKSSMTEGDGSNHNGSPGAPGSRSKSMIADGYGSPQKQSLYSPSKSSMTEGNGSPRKQPNSHAKVCTLHHISGYNTPRFLEATHTNFTGQRGPAMTMEQAVAQIRNQQPVTADKELLAAKERQYKLDAAREIRSWTEAENEIQERNLAEVSGSSTKWYVTF